jgi:hypothetical protein
MKPGPELDALVAEKVMELKEVKTAEEYAYLQNGGGDFFGKLYFCSCSLWNSTFKTHRPGRTIPVVKSYSTSIEAAWRVVEAMQQRGWHLALEVGLLGCGATFLQDELKAVSDAMAPTTPEAICLAALRVLGVSI